MLRKVTKNYRNHVPVGSPPTRWLHPNPPHTNQTHVYGNHGRDFLWLQNRTYLSTKWEQDNYNRAGDLIRQKRNRLWVHGFRGYFYDVKLANLFFWVQQFSLTFWPHATFRTAKIKYSYVHGPLITTMINKYTKCHWHFCLQLDRIASKRSEIVFWYF